MPYHNGHDAFAKLIESEIYARMAKAQGAAPEGVLEGRSGARVVLFKDRVEKYGDARVLAQGNYITDLGLIVCPKIYHISESCYTMERLYSIFKEPVVLENVLVGAMRAEQALFQAKMLLAANVWPRPYTTSVEAFASPIGKQYWYRNLLPTLNQDMAQWAEKVFTSFEGCDAPATYVHGDPTLENIMTRKGDEDVCIVDPLPPQPKLPMSWHVDMGKLLQSASGFEGITFPRDLPDRLIGTVEPRDADACWFFCALAFHRMIPYANGDELKRVVDFRELILTMHFRD